MRQLITNVFPALLLALIVDTVFASNYDDVRTKDLIPVQREVADLRPNRPQQVAYGEKPLKVTAWVDRENSTYRTGESVKFFVRVNRDAYITMLNVGSSGKSHVIFPNSYQQNNFVMAGETLQLPHPSGEFDFQVSGPAGSDTTKIIATLEDVDPISRNFTKRAGKYRIVTKDLNVVVRKANNLLNSSSSPITWDEYTKVITIKN